MTRLCFIDRLYSSKPILINMSSTSILNISTFFPLRPFTKYTCQKYFLPATNTVWSPIPRVRRRISLPPARTALWMIRSEGVTVSWWFWGRWWISLTGACAEAGQTQQRLSGHESWIPTLPLPSWAGSSCSLTQEQPLLRSQSCSYYLSLNGLVSLRDSPYNLWIKPAGQKTKALISEGWRCFSELQVPFLTGDWVRKQISVK